MASPDAPTRDVFVVDDDPDARDALAALLVDAGYRVTLFADGASLLNEARASPPSCILLDLYMPGGSGLDILARLDARHAKNSVDLMRIVFRKTDEPTPRRLSA